MPSGDEQRRQRRALRTQERTITWVEAAARRMPRPGGFPHPSLQTTPHPKSRYDPIENDEVDFRA